MNNINSKTIRDISSDIGAKNGVSKNAVEELFNHFYQKVVKSNLLSFEKRQYSIKLFGTFTLNMTPVHLATLEKRFNNSLIHYTEEVEKLKEEAPAWVSNSHVYYQKIIKNLEKLKEEDKELYKQKLIKKEARKNYV